MRLVLQRVFSCENCESGRHCLWPVFWACSCFQHYCIDSKRRDFFTTIVFKFRIRGKNIIVQAICEVSGMYYKHWFWRLYILRILRSTWFAIDTGYNIQRNLSYHWFFFEKSASTIHVVSASYKCNYGLISLKLLKLNSWLHKTTLRLWWNLIKLALYNAVDIYDMFHLNIVSSLIKMLNPAGVKMYDWW